MSDNCRGLHLKKLQLESNSQPSNTYDLLRWQKEVPFLPVLPWSGIYNYF